MRIPKEAGQADARRTLASNSFCSKYDNTNKLAQGPVATCVTRALHIGRSLVAGLHEAIQSKKVAQLDSYNSESRALTGRASRKAEADYWAGLPFSQDNVHELVLGPA